MFHLSFILVLFLYQLSVGCMVALALMPLQEVDRKFYQLSSGLSSFLMALGLGLSLYYPFQLPESFGVSAEMQEPWIRFRLPLSLAYGLVIFILYVRMRLQKISFAKALVRLGSFLGVLLLANEGLLFRPKNLHDGFLAVQMPLDFVAASLFLGIFMLAMVFGHWYLIKPMPKKLLKRMAETLIIVLVLRLLIVGVTLWLYSTQVPGGYDTIRILMDFNIGVGHGIFFWQRILIGLGVPLILSYMIWSTAKIGANQSATGLLYVGVVFVIIGEMISKYLLVISGIPI